MEFENLDEALANPTDRRLFAVGKAMLDEQYSVDRIHEITKIDKWFLHKLANIRDVRADLKLHRNATAIPSPLLKAAKQMGFSDQQIAKCVGATELQVRATRKSHGIVPFVKRIDTLAGEVPAVTNYLYTTYNGTTDDLPFNDNGIIVLGSGVYRIGSSVEFDWCGVSCTRSLRDLGKKTVMINYNPETVSTDYDVADRLYFEELSYERVMDIYEKEASSGVIVSVGGQLPQNMALKLHQSPGVKVLGTDPVMIDAAEDRFKFSSILDKIGVDQPAWKELTNVNEAKQFASQVGYDSFMTIT